MRTGHFTPVRRMVAGALLGLCAVAVGADEFNDQRLQDGRIAYQQRKYIDAINEFRVAAFGSLDRPAGLQECLARLALAESAAGQTAETSETLNRFLEVERRFGAYGKANLEPEIRADFQALLLRSVPPATLLAVPSLAGLVETEEQKIARLPVADRQKALEAWAKREPNSAGWQVALARAALERGDPKEAERRAAKALSLDPGNAEARTLQARARELTAPRPKQASVPAAPQATPVPRPTAGSGSTDNAQTQGADLSPAATASRSKQALDDSRRLVSAGKAGEAVPILTASLKSDPGNRDLRLALLEAACLSRAYDKGAAQVALVAPFGDGEAPSMFYAAVVLYETGKANEARGFFKQAAPTVKGPLVDEYSKKILAAP